LVYTSCWNLLLISVVMLKFASKISFHLCCIHNLYIPQLASSELSEQSLSPSHLHLLGMHLTKLAHLNSSDEHVSVGATAATVVAEATAPACTAEQH